MLVECTNKYHKHKRNHTINKRARKRKLEKTFLVNILPGKELHCYRSCHLGESITAGRIYFRHLVHGISI